MKPGSCLVSARANAKARSCFRRRSDADFGAGFAHSERMGNRISISASLRRAAAGNIRVNVIYRF